MASCCTLVGRARASDTIAAGTALRSPSGRMKRLRSCRFIHVSISEEKVHFSSNIFYHVAHPRRHADRKDSAATPRCDSPHAFLSENDFLFFLFTGLMPISSSIVNRGLAKVVSCSSIVVIIIPSVSSVTPLPRFHWGPSNWWRHRR